MCQFFMEECESKFHWKPIGGIGLVVESNRTQPK